MGTSDRQFTNNNHESSNSNNNNDDDEGGGGGGVEASKSSVLANYFLKSHGGAHALQSICSLLAVGCTLPAFVWVGNRRSSAVVVWIQRCMMFAMTKHLSGLLAATIMCAKAIPDVGWRTAKKWMEQLALDPVSQYVFYAALIMVWLPPPPPTEAASYDTTTVWWWNRKGIPFLLVGPIFIREAISMAFVLSDILLVLSIPTPTTLSSVVDAIMSLLVTPELWRTANAAQRQAMLAKGTSRTCLVLEVLVGILLALDGVHSLLELVSWSLPRLRPSLSSVLKRCICARLYLHFLWTRKRSITKLAHQIRGGASAFPFHVLNVLLHPVHAMGLDLNNNMDENTCRFSSWKDYTVMALGLDED